MTCIAIQVYTGKEFTVAQKLKERLQQDIIIPAQEKLTINPNGKTSIGYEYLYPGYLLIELKEMTASIWNAIKDIPGVISILDGEVKSSELEFLKTKMYPILEVKEKTNIEQRASRVLRKTEIGLIIEKIRKNTKIIQIPARLINKAINYTETAFNEATATIPKKILKILTG